MKTILVINDQSSEAEHAAEIALNIAKKVNAGLLLANIAKVSKRMPAKAGILITGEEENVIFDTPDQNLVQRLQARSAAGASGFEPEIKTLNVSGYAEKDLAELIIKNNIWMMVEGVSNLADLDPVTTGLNIQAVLNRVMCPLLLVPEKYKLKDFERMVYTADLRYCRLQVVKYLADLAAPFCADLMIAHLSAEGLPDMEENYAFSIFNEEVSDKIKYEKLHFNNIRERNLNTAVDVMINGMHSDLLVMVNHRFHFEEIIGRYIQHTLPAHITIPVLIFPY